MTEELMKIDRSAIEQLVRIRRDEEVLRDRVAKAESSKEKVSPVVYQRVSADYRARLDALEREARPLKDAARREYAKLRLLEAQYSKSLEEVTVDKEELEFRNQLGEFADGEYAAKMTEFEQKVAEQKARVDAATVLKSEFRAAFSSDADLEGSTLPQSAPQPIPQPVTPPVVPPVIVHPPAPPPDAHVVIPPASKAPPIPIGLEPPDPLKPARGRAASALNKTTEVKLEAPERKKTESGFAELFGMPKLIAITNGKPGEEFVLSPKTSIGRTSKNDIQVLDDSVSRQHCEVVLAADGYRLIDLGSHNGVAVNGERVADRLLADGDLVEVGTRQFIFKMA